MLEIFLPICLFPVLEGFRAKPKDFDNSIKRRKVIEDLHDRNVADLVNFLFSYLLIGLNIQINHEIT